MLNTNNIGSFFVEFFSANQPAIWSRISSNWYLNESVELIFISLNCSKKILPHMKSLLVQLDYLRLLIFLILQSDLFLIKAKIYWKTIRLVKSCRDV